MSTVYFGPFTPTEIAIVEEAANAWLHMQWHLLTTRSVPIRIVKSLVEAGMLESVGDVHVCDGDGFAKEPERFREGYRLTSDGWMLVDMIVHQRAILVAAFHAAEAP